MILVTGASGNIGSEVVRALAQRQVAFRTAVRTPPASSAATAVHLDLRDARTYAPAVAGCTAVFLLRPPAIANTRQTLNRFLDVARAQGVAQVVFVSVAGAADNPVVPHHAVEQHLRAGPAGWTILRPGFFAQNIGDAYRDDIRQDDRIFLPAGAGRVAFVDTRDIAAVAATALIDPAAHRQQMYHLTGQTAHTFAEVAQILTAELARPIRYQAASIPAYAAHLGRRGLPPMQILVQTILHAGLRAGQAAAVDDTLARLLGHPPYTLHAYVHDYRQRWLRPG